MFLAEYDIHRELEVDRGAALGMEVEAWQRSKLTKSRKVNQRSRFWRLAEKLSYLSSSSTVDTHIPGASPNRCIRLVEFVVDLPD